MCYIVYNKNKAGLCVRTSLTNVREKHWVSHRVVSATLTRAASVDSWGGCSGSNR